jgi:hypothetical protein
MSKTTVFHRYKWTLEEKLTLTLPSILIPAGLAYFSMQKGELAVGWAITLAVWIGSFFLLGHIGSSKKKISRLEAIFDEETTETSVEGNKIYNHKTNAGKISLMTGAQIKQVGQNPTLILSSRNDEVKNLNIPVRLASKQPFLDFLIKNVLENDSIKKEHGVTEYFDEAKVYKR